MSRLGQRSDPCGGKKEDSTAAGPASKGGEKSPADFSDHNELAAIMKALGVTRETFSGYLGIGRPCLSSYLYRAVKSVPEDVMQRARRIAEDASREIERINALYRYRSMSKILLEWRRRFALPKSDIPLADVLGVDLATVRRWKKDEVKPTVRKLLEYEARLRQSIGNQLISNW